MEKKKSKSSRELAKVINDSVLSEKQQANLISRPLRLAFILQDDLAPENLWLLLTYISSIWGGYYSCLISTDGSKLSEVDWRSLNLYEPDKVVFCANDKDAFSQDLITKIQREILPFSLVMIDNWNPNGDFLNIEMKRNNDPLISSIPLIVPMVHHLEELKQPIEESKSNVRIPDVQSQHPYALCVAAQIGLVSDYNKRTYIEEFKAQNIELAKSSIREYLEFASEFENKFTPLNMTKLYVQITVTLIGKSRPDGLNIVFVGKNKVQDLCLFWNLRLAQSVMEKSTLLILPFDAISTGKKFQEFCDSIKLTPWANKKINFFSASVRPNRLKKFEIRFKKEMTSTSKVSFVQETFPVAYFHTKSGEETAESTIEKKVFSFRSPKLKFSDLLRGGDWGVDIKFSPPYEYPNFTKINHFLCGSPKEDFYRFHNGYWVRSAHEKIVHRMNTKTNFLRGQLLSDEQAYQEFFQDKGLEIRLTEKHSYAEGFLKLLQNPDILDDVKVIDMLWRLQKQDAYTYDDLCAELRKGDDGADLIDVLVSKRVLLRGMKFKCDACGLSRFYPINTLNEEVQCPGCLNYLQPPSRAPIMFRLNELAARAVEQGSIPVLLTHKFLGKLSINKTLRLFGTEVVKDNIPTDVDYTTTYRGDLVFVECKDFKQGASPKEKRGAIQQLSKLVELAKQVDAPIVILSTLLPYPSSDYNDLAYQVEKIKTKNKISVHLLSLSGNGIVNLKKPEKLVERPFLLD